MLVHSLFIVCFQVPMGAGPDRPHEELHRALRPRLGQAGEAGAVQGEDARQDGRRGAHREGKKCCTFYQILLHYKTLSI